MDELLDKMIRIHFDKFRELTMLGELSSQDGEKGILLFLYYYRQTPILSGTLKDLTGLTSGRVANILKQLERKGLITRDRDDEDQRKVMVSLTSEGLDKSAAEFQGLVDINRDLLVYLGDEDARDFIRVFERTLDFAGTKSN